MKTWIFAMLLMSVSAFLHGAESAIVGTWTGKDAKGDVGGFVFRSDGSADLIKDGKSFAAARLRPGSSITFTFDDASSPKTVDVFMNDERGQMTIMLGIVEFVDRDSIRIRVSNRPPRPVDFNGTDNDTIVLKRTEA